MKKLFAVAVMVAASVAFAQAPAGSKTEGQDQMGGWMPEAVTKRDTKGIAKMMMAWHKAFMAKDLNAAAEYLDFPVLMVTDDGKGNVTAATWDKDTWVKNMTQSMSKMPPMKPGMKMPMPKTKYDFITNDIASVFASMTMPMGKKSMTTNSHCLVVLKDGKWLVKSMTEGGWGNAMGGGEGAQK